MTTKHYTLIVGVLIIVLLAVFIAVSKKSSDIVIENPANQNVLFNNTPVPSAVTSTTTVASEASSTASSTSTNRAGSTDPFIYATSSDGSAVNPR